MNNQKYSLIQVGALAMLSNFASAAIKTNGLWTGHPFYDLDNNYGVKNGVPYSDDDDVDRRMKAPVTVDGSVDDTYLTSANVKLIKSFMDEAKFKKAFPQRNAIYTYDNFLKAVAKFPYFCNETNLDNWSVKDTCKRELATMFAHWDQETGERNDAHGDYWTQGLYYVEEYGCNKTGDDLVETNAHCNYRTDKDKETDNDN